MLQRSFLLGLLALAGSAALAPGAGAQEPNTIKIVSSLPHTGSANAQTNTIVNGVRLALEEAGNKAGNFTIVYEAWDDASPERGQWDPAVEAANADRAIADPSVMAYIGTYNSGAAKIAMPKLNQAGMLMVSPGNTWPGLTKPGVGEPNEPMVYRPSKKVTYFRVVPADDIQGLVAAQWTKEMGCKRVFLLHDRELYGKGIATMYEKEAKKQGLEVVGLEGIDPKASNYRSLVTKIKQKRPDLVYFGGTTQTNAGQIAKDLRSANLQVKYMVPDGCFENAFIEAAGAENVEGTAFITFGGVPADQLTGPGKVFYENYKKRFNAEPQAYAAYGYECGRVVLEAIKRAGKKDRAAIVDACATIKDFEGLLGRWSFDENGDTTVKTMSGNTVRGGKFEFVKVFGDSQP
ncbi:MAG: branched-chain amino acid ABC transporter substrate-binding protein [Candidatus Hydrogenedentes bacterium]|nr:branched-chain amino acid ABC transporter substrate-binding protein [Candidatus Hydrogenedentota bacterium]